MRTRTLIRLAVVLSLAGMSSAAFAASANDYKAAFGKAEAAAKQSHKMKAAWTTTDKELKAAKKAADAGKFDDAVKHAKMAEALAEASIAQSKEQAKIWQNAGIH